MSKPGTMMVQQSTVMANYDTVKVKQDNDWHNRKQGCHYNKVITQKDTVMVQEMIIKEQYIIAIS